MADQNVTLVGHDGAEVLVSKTILAKFPWFSGMLNLEEGKDVFHSEVVDGYTLQKIVNWMEYEGNGNMPILFDPDTGIFRDLTSWEESFVENIDDEDLVDLMQTADFFSMNNLLEILTAITAQRIQTYPIEKIRAMFRITESGFTPQEEEKLTNEIRWALQFQD